MHSSIAVSGHRLLQGHRAASLLSGVALLSVLAVAPIRFAYCQPPEPATATAPGDQSPGDQTPKKPAGPKTLEEVLPELDWDVAKRGPLIIVNPKFITRFQPTPGNFGIGGPETEDAPTEVGEDGKPVAGVEVPPGENPYIIPPAPRTGYNLNQLAPMLSQRIVRLPTLTALAPNTMPVIPSSVPPSLLPFMDAADYDTSASLTIFLGTLTEAQWRQIGSPEGLGTSGLNEQQRYFFSRLLPSKASIQQVRREQTGDQKPPPAIPMTQALRSQMRVRILKRYTLVFLKNGTEQPIGGHSGDASQEYFVGGTPDLKQPEMPKFQEPNHLKPGQMDLEAPVFAHPISLDGVKTVGDLVQRISEASRIELYADGRVARLPVYVRGTEANCGDVLKALCWSLSSTFRKLESGGQTFFLLTSDLEPLGPKLSRLTDSLLDLLLSTQQKRGDNRRLQTEAANRVFAMKPLRLLQAAPIVFREPAKEGIPASPPVEFMPPDTIQKQLTRRDLIGEREPKEQPNALRTSRSSDAYLPVTALPDEVRARLKRDMDSMNQNTKDTKDQVRLDKVGVTMDIKVEFSLPQYGIVQNYELQPITPTPQPPVPSELTFPKGKRVVAMPVGTPEQARAFMAAARERGFNQVWLTLPDTLSEEEERAVITAAIAAGKPTAPGGAAIEVVAQVPLLGRTPPEKPDFDSDRTITGMGSAEWARMRQQSPIMGAMPAFRRILARSPDWLLPDSPKAQARVARITRLAATPGLSGIALNHIAPPGLFSGTGFEERVMDGLLFADVGYTPAVRAAFVRKQGTDPADFPFPLMSLFIGSMFIGNHPYLKMDESIGPMLGAGSSENKDPMFATINEWLKERRTLTQALLTKVYQGVTKARPNLPLWTPDTGWIRRNMNVPTGASWWGTWDSPDRLPGSEPAPSRFRNGEEEQAPPPSLDETAHKTSRAIYRTLSFSGWQIQDEFEEGFSLLMQTEDEERTLFGYFLANELKPLRDSKQTGRWNGYMLDLSDRPYKSAMGLFAVLPKATAAVLPK